VVQLPLAPTPLVNPHIDVTTSECSLRNGVTSLSIKVLCRDRHQGETHEKLCNQVFGYGDMRDAAGDDRHSLTRQRSKQRRQASQEAREEAAPGTCRQQRQVFKSRVPFDV
jgi:hypothetical protein